MRETGRDWPHISGVMTARQHSLPIRVYYEDTDFSGVVYHAGFLRFCERGRTDFLRLAGVSHTELGKEGYAFAVRRLEADFLKPARIDDLLIVKTDLVKLGGASLTLSQAVFLEEICLFKLLVKVAVIDGAGRPARLPEAILKALQLYEIDAQSR